MGRRGPAPKDKTLRTVDFTGGVPAAPEWLCPEALAEYDRITEILLSSGEGLQMVDMSMLATYAQCYADVCRLTAEIRLCGETLMSDKGVEYINPKWNILQGTRNSMIAAASKLGFSPSDRSRITVPTNAKKKDSNPLAALLEGVSGIPERPRNALRS